MGFSVLNFFIFATDFGSTNSLVYFFRRARADGTDFARYVAAVESLRRTVFGLGTVVVAVAFPLAALAQGFRIPETLLVVVAICLGVWFQIGAAVRLLVLRLSGNLGLSYRAEIAGGAVRLVLALVLAAPALLTAWLALAAAAAGSAVTAYVARWAGPPTPPPTGALGPHRRHVVRYLLPTLPAAIHFSVQGPLIVWLSASFGSMHNVAEVGALGRLGAVMALFNGLVGIVFLPRLANPTDERLWRRRYLQYGGFLAGIAMALVGAAILAPGLFLFLLGDKYAGLNTELRLVMVSAALSLLDGYADGVNHSRAWTRWQGATVSLIVAAQVLFVAALDLSTTPGVLTFAVLTGVVGLAIHLGITLVAFARPAWVEWKVVT